MTYVGKFGVPDIAKLPKLFRGCTWTEPRWEFDAPSVVYYPFPLYGTDGVESLVEDYCIDLAIGDRKFTKPTLKLTGFTKKEFKWRGWSIMNMRNRKAAWHREYAIIWRVDSYDRVEFDMIQTYAGKGPQKK